MIKDTITKTANSLGITEIGFVDALEFSKQNIINSSSFSKSKNGADVFSVMNGAKSIIVYLAPYLTNEKPSNISKYAIGLDYHLVCKKISDTISDIIINDGFKALAFTDSGILNERALARLAGLGIIGKNGFLINEKYGTYTFISYIVTDMELEKSTPLRGNCLGCDKCIKLCPGGALSSGRFTESKCVSYITQKKGELTQSEKALIKNSGTAWGCDICQDVCPMNKNTLITNINEFSDNLILHLEKENISGRKFKDKYKNRAFSWRGKGVIDRNLSILNEK